MAVKKGLGLEQKIKKMHPKLRDLYLNILQIIIVITGVYGIISFVLEFRDSGNFLSWFTTPDFALVTISLVLFVFVQMLLLGRLNVLEEQKNKPKTVVNMPNIYANKTSQFRPPNQEKTPLNIPNYFGTNNQQYTPKRTKQVQYWQCPICKTFVRNDTNRCTQCGYQR